MNAQFSTEIERIDVGIAGMLPPRPTLEPTAKLVSFVNLASAGSVPVSLLPTTFSVSKLAKLATSVGTVPISANEFKISAVRALSRPTWVGIVVRVASDS